MELPEELLDLINKAYRDANLYYIGIFIKNKEIVSRTSSKSDKLSISFGRLIERSLELNEILPNFKEEFLFSEGKDYSLFVYYVEEELSIGMIHIGKPNFSMLKIVGLDLAKEIKKYKDQLKEIYLQEVQTITIKEETSEEATQVKQEVFKQDENRDFFKDEINELEKVLSFKEYELKEDITQPSLEDILTTQKEEELSYEPPPLEEILTAKTEEEKLEPPSLEQIISDRGSVSEDSLINTEEILEKIKNEFVREIGPFGMLLFKKKKEEYFKTRNVTKFEILKFIQLLAEEISVEKRRNEFIENAKSLLINL
ncbi:MAG: hypothetical protein N2Z81_03880 [Hydrogenothermaceae bacterium]|nr:hypothetical protein [Hydrogenothermaceae bacterium]